MIGSNEIDPVDTNAGVIVVAVVARSRCISDDDDDDDDDDDGNAYDDGDDEYEDDIVVVVDGFSLLNRFCLCFVMRALNGRLFGIGDVVSLERGEEEESYS